MNNKLIIGLAVVLIIGVVGWFLPTSNPVTKQVIEQTKETLGSASSPSVNDGCTEINGVRHCYYGAHMNTASSTCSFPLHNAASTTVTRAVATITNARGAGYDAAWGWGANYSATTTSLGKFGEATWQAALFNNMTAVASTSIADMSGASHVDPAFIVAPNSFLNFKVGTTSHAIAGYCAAETIMAI